MTESALESLKALVETVPTSDPGAKLAPCPHCSANSWSAQKPLTGDTSVLHFECDACHARWLRSGGLARLKRIAVLEKNSGPLPSQIALDLVPVASAEQAPKGLPGPSAPAPVALLPAPAPPVAPARRPYGRIPFDRGIANIVAVPLCLALAFLFSSSESGAFLGSLVAMPFHELGHALASWVSSRFAVPLPFFTIWLHEQSVLFGLFVAAIITWLGVHSWREKSHFGVALAALLLTTQLIVSWLVPARCTLALQLLSGALGEIALGALLLVGFHFPLPDRLRWDFWRWLAIGPASISFAQAVLLWLRAASDPSQMPWGSAVGGESDGDMNRLVQGFGWTARELTIFYLKACLIASLAVLTAYAVAVRRHWVGRGHE